MADYRITECEEHERVLAKVFNRDGQFLFWAKDIATARSMLEHDHCELAARCFRNPAHAGALDVMVEHLIPEPFNLDMMAFLQGNTDLDIDSIFGKPLDSLLRDYSVDLSGPSQPSLTNEAISVHYHDAGVIMTGADRRIVGAYLGCDLSLLREYQGRGLGTELVIETCLVRGLNPAAQLDTAAYTPAGYAAHKAAWHLARSDQAELRHRYTRWLASPSPKRKCPPPVKATGMLSRS